MNHPKRTTPGTALLVVLLSAGCALKAPSYRAHVSESIEQKTGHGLQPEQEDAGIRIPPEHSLDDGLTENEAVAIALWNNAAFRADLARLGFARAELLDAGLLKNPVLSFLFPVGPKQMEATAYLPLELFWQRARRVAAAKLDYQRLAESLIENGLNLARDARIAYADWHRAQESVRLAEQSVQLRREIADLFEARLRAGDVSELEAHAARIEERLAAEQAAGLSHQVTSARDRLGALLGLDGGEGPRPELTMQLSPPEGKGIPGVAELERTALASRPDLRAAELAVEAEAERVRLEHRNRVAVSAGVDTNSRGRSGFEAGPSLQTDLPVLQRNQGGIGKAEARAEQAAFAYEATRQRILLEVREAYNGLLGAQEALMFLRREVLPSLEESAALAARSYELGDVSYLFVLESRRPLVDAQQRELEADSAVRRARAELDRNVGARIAF